MHKRVLLVLAAGLALSGIAMPAFGAPIPAREMLADGEAWPAVATAELMSPKPHNNLLEADIAVEAVDESTVATYEYRWNDAEAITLSATNPTVSYETIDPSATHKLDVRVIDVNHNVSDWFTVWTGTTPDAPNVIVAGDSIASGYTRQWFTGDAACVDLQHSYGSVVASEIAADLPTQWSPTYSNIAWAGAGVEHMAKGGSDSCGTSHPSQVDQIREIASEATWNVIVVTAGINSTNWTDVVVDLTRDATFSFTSAGDRSLCGSALADRWNIASRKSFLTNTTASVTEAITTATNAHVLWTGYYDITDTELAPLWRPITGACSGAMTDALDSLHGALRAGLAERVTWVDIDGEISTQQWAGWPHPDAHGQATIGRRVAAALNL